MKYIVILLAMTSVAVAQVSSDQAMLNLRQRQAATTQPAAQAKAFAEMKAEVALLRAQVRELTAENAELRLKLDRPKPTPSSTSPVADEDKSLAEMDAKLIGMEIAKASDLVSSGKLQAELITASGETSHYRLLAGFPSKRFFTYSFNVRDGKVVSCSRRLWESSSSSSGTFNAAGVR